MAPRTDYESFSSSPSSPLCRQTLHHTDQVLGLARDLVTRAMIDSPPARARRQNQHLQEQVFRSSNPRARSYAKGATSKGESRADGSPLRSYAKGKNALWLLNSDSFSSVTMKTLIEKQAAAAAHLSNNSSRLENFASCSPSRRPRAGDPPTSARSDPRGGSRGVTNADATPPVGRRAESSGGIALSELVSATSPPRRSSMIKMGGGVTVEARGREDAARRSLAQETYTKTFSGMQAYGESGMTVLEELIDAAFRACDVGHAHGQQRVTGAAVLTRSGKIYAGCNVESSSVDLCVGAERTTVLKAVSEGETRFRSLAMASDTEQAFPSPDGPGRQFLAEFGEFPVYLVNRDMQVKIASTGELYPMMPPGPPVGGHGLGPGGARDEAIVAASREREKQPPKDWGVQEVLDWLEDELELGQYRREFARAKVDGTLLLNLEARDLQDMLGISHSLHRRRICLGIQRIKEKENEELGNNYGDMEEYVKRLDRDRIRLITKLKVVFDRFDTRGTGSISADDARSALEYMGRDVAGEACASWLADKGKQKGGDISFVDFTTAYSALFADDDPDVDLGAERPRGGKDGVISITESGHVRLREKEPRGVRRLGDGERERGGRGGWAGSSSGGEEREEGLRVGRNSSSPRKTPRSGGGGENDLMADAGSDGKAFEALQSVKKLAEVKRVFDRFAVDGMLTANEALQALTEAGCTAPRTHAGRYLRSRRFFGLRREVTFFEFLRSMAALGVHDSGAHVAGFAPSTMAGNGPYRAGSFSSCRYPRNGYARRNASGSWERKGLERKRRSARSSSSWTQEEDEAYGSVDDTSSNGGIQGRERITEHGRGRRRSGRGGGEGVGKFEGHDGNKIRNTAWISPNSRQRGPSVGRRRYGSSPQHRSAARSGKGRRLDSSEGSEEEWSRGRRTESHSSRSHGGKGQVHGRRRSRTRGGTSSGSASTCDSASIGGEGSVFDHRTPRRRQGRVKDKEDSKDARERDRRGGRGEDRISTRGEVQERGIDHEKGDKERGRRRDCDRKVGREKEMDTDKDVTRRDHHDRSTDAKKERDRGREQEISSRYHEKSRREESDEGRGDGSTKEKGRRSSASLRKGDKVEARYRGRGTRFFEGKVTRINSDNTLDIIYDNGDKESGIAEEHVRLLEEAPMRDHVCHNQGDSFHKLSKGDAVEARYHGKGTKFYRGQISRVNTNGTYDIDYDDGDREVRLCGEHVRAVESPGRSCRDHGDSSIEEGDRVEVNYRGRGRYIKGYVSRVNFDRTFNISYDDGEEEQGVLIKMIRKMGAKPDQREKGVGMLRKGDRVKARYRGKGTQFYGAKVARVNSDGTFDIHYDDGKKEIGLPEQHIVPLETVVNSETGHGLAVGDSVEARYRGRGTKFFKGKIVRVNSDDTFDIDYDDGDKERGIAEEHVRSLGGTRNDGGRGGRSDGTGVELDEGDKVEANYRGRGKYYKGRIQRVNRDGTFDINYDDGRKERGTPKDMVRALDKPISHGRERDDGGSLQRGDKIEARYRGRGTKFYKGKISRVNSDGTFDIDYDDGEKEIGIRGEHVRSQEQRSSSDDDRRRGRAASFREGDRVEANYRGRGRYYLGRVSRVSLDGTFNIDFDDGEKERGVGDDLIRFASKKNDGRGSALQEGDKVEARYRGRGTKFFKGKIVRVNSDDTFDIDYDDGDTERGIAEEHVRSLGGTRNDGGRGGRSDGTGVELDEGDKVEANYRGRGKYYKGRIQRVNRDGTFDINYDDGEKERGTPKDMVRALDKPISHGRERDDGGSLQRGDKVEARYRGRGTKFYKGKISRVNSDGTFDIDYDDDEKEIGIRGEHVRSQEQRSSSDDDRRRGRPASFREGDRVEANYRGRGRYYPGRVSRVNLDGTFNIDFDDGEKERGVIGDLIRFASEMNDGRGSALQEGDKVEARYRGRGTKFFKGKIVRVNSDDTFDIDYDDGDTERGIAEEHVRSLGGTRNDGGRGGRSDGTGVELDEGDKVEANYRGRGKYYKGRIQRVNRDGTFDINYDDGEKERGTPKDMVRALDKPISLGRERDDGGSLQRGDKIEARYRGRGTQFNKGKISRVNSDGTFDIDYDDGEKEIGIRGEHVRSQEQRSSSDDDRRRGRAASFREGDRVEANYRGRGQYYPGRVSRVNLDGTFNIDFDDGEKERGVGDDLIRFASKKNDGRGSALQEGDKVEARYRGRGTKFFKGKIVRVNSDDTFDIDYDDGDTERGIAEEHVRSLGGTRNDGGRGGRSDGTGVELDEGDKVEANYRGRGKYYKGRIQRVNRDGTFDINYDDGEKERSTPKDMVRALDKPTSHGRERGDGGSLQRGDKVEARYRGRGTKFYKGKISRVNSDGTFDIDYDDGEKEIGIRGEHVRSQEQRSSSDDDRRRGRAASFREGDRVEANYRGRGRYYPGRVSRVNLDDTFNIDFDDGEKERGVGDDLIRFASEKNDGRGSALQEGDKVEARYRGRGTKFFKGKIVRVNSDDTFDIDYDDGDKERGIAEEHVRSLGGTRNDGGRGGRSDGTGVELDEGDKVEANYRGRGKYYKGRIQRVNRDGTFDINYDDGEKERGTPKDMVRALDKPTSHGRERDDGGSLQRGDKIEARCRGRGTQFYKGKISRVNSDGTFDIDYDDDEKEIGIRGEHVRSQEQRSSSDDDRRRGRAASFREGDRVEANYRGRGRYYPGRVSRVNLDGTFNIDFDDGEKERGVGDDLIRFASEKEDGRGSALQEGDKVEARYRGQGTKFFKGKIVRVNSDDTFDIDYDDGDKERGIAEEHVRSLGGTRSDGGRGGRSDGTGVELDEGDKVEANYRGRGKYYKGRIQRVNRDSTFDINYDDGEKERSTPKDMVRALDKPTSHGRERDDGGSLQRGDKVEARYRGRGTKFYKGKISRVNSDGTFDIDYDDGEKEIGIRGEHVRSQEQRSSSDDDRRRGRAASFREGDRVEANYRGRGRYYPGRVSRVNLDGTFNIDFDDGEKERGVIGDLIRTRGGDRQVSPSERTRDTSLVNVRGATYGNGISKAGDIVEARYRGQGTKFYKGTIVRVNSDATLDIDYDDGDKERSLDEKHVKSLGYRGKR